MRIAKTTTACEIHAHRQKYIYSRRLFIYLDTKSIVSISWKLTRRRISRQLLFCAWPWKQMYRYYSTEAEFMGTELRVLRVEVYGYNIYITNQFQIFFAAALSTNHRSFLSIALSCNKACNYGQYTVKRFTSFPSPAGMSLTKLPLGRNNSVMTSLFTARESLVVTSRLGTGNSRTFFLRCKIGREKNCFYVCWNEEC